MRNKILGAVINIITIVINIALGYLLNLIFFKSDKTYLIMFLCGVISFSCLVVYIICKRLGFKLDIYAYEIEEKSYLILNNIFIGNLFSVPLAMIFSIL